MARLIPLSDIPYSARAREANERAKWPTRQMALDAASIEIVSAPGCYSGAYAPTIGWVLTRQAGDALAARLTHMPGGTCHRELAAREAGCSTDALGEYVEAVARGSDRTAALARYEAARAAS